MIPTPKKSTRLADDAIDSLHHAPMQATQEVEDAMKEAEAAGEKTEFLARFRERFRTLDEKVRGEIVKNLEDLLTRGTTEGLAALKTETDAMQTLLEKEAANIEATQPPKMLQAGFLPSMDQLKSAGTSLGNTFENAADVVLPRQWTAHMSRSQKIGVSAVTGVAAAYVAYKVGKWLFGRGKKSAEVATQEAKKTEGGFFKKLAVGLGIGALAFGSYKAYEMYKELGSFKDMVMKMGEELTDKVKDGVGRVKEELGLKVEEAEEDAEQLSENFELPPIEMEAEQVAKVSEVASRSATASGLLLLHHDLAEQAGINFENSIEPEKVSDVLKHPTVSGLSVTELSTVDSIDSAKILVQKYLPEGQPEMTELQAKAVLFLGLICKQSLSKPSVQDLITKGEVDVETLTLKDFVSITSISSSFTGKLVEALKDSTLSEAVDINVITESIFSSPDSIHELSNNPVISRRVASLHPAFVDKKILVGFGVYCFGPGQNGNRSLKDVVTPASENLSEEEKVYAEALSSIQREIQSEKAQKYLLQYAQGNSEYEKTISDYLRRGGFRSTRCCAVIHVSSNGTDE